METGCDIHTHAHAQESLQDIFREQMGTNWSLWNFWGQGHGYEYHSPEKLNLNRLAMTGSGHGCVPGEGS